MKDRLSAYFLLVFVSLSACFGLMAGWSAYAEGIGGNVRSWLNGESVLKYEKTYNAALATYNPSLLAWSTVNFLVFQEGNKGVLIGADRWLFTDEEFITPTDAAKAIEEKKTYIKEVQERLAASGTKLLIAPIPAKSRIYADKLGRYPYPAYKAPIYDMFMSDLASLGIESCNLEKPLSVSRERVDVFFKTDTHWTPAGSSAAASAIADCVRHSLKDISLKKTDFTATKAAQTSALKGDLTRYVPLGPWLSKMGFEEEPYLTTEWEEKGAGAIDANALFDEDAPDVTLVGTSYSANPNWQFADFLQDALSTKILNAADQGLGPFETMKKYLADESFKQTPPKLLVWEMPERYLTMPFNPNEKKNNHDE